MDLPEARLYRITSLPGHVSAGTRCCRQMPSILYPRPLAAGQVVRRAATGIYPVRRGDHIPHPAAPVQKGVAIFKDRW